jgi:hypothetical protein
MKRLYRIVTVLAVLALVFAAAPVALASESSSEQLVLSQSQGGNLDLEQECSRQGLVLVQVEGVAEKDSYRCALVLFGQVIMVFHMDLDGACRLQYGDKFLAYFLKGKWMCLPAGVPVPAS